ncbi:hypothetical protein Ahy_A06g028951 [Arachis hypogaea]|uniref:Uncharacterized protein n=1 Tax=Arachis hypogaea TaxID=3818 RepID=A0A445CS17_ARAHY|nr:hypothetical protein Ahy_A06g028951 [Arachis hypogaea]
MHDHGLPSSKIMGLKVGQAGGYANVGFTKKDLDNHIQRTCRAKLIDDFEEYDKKYRLEKNDWVLNEYEKRKNWASAYLRDKFCAGFRTTSRCEAINNFIKRFICIRQSLIELVQNLEHALRDYRHNELDFQFKTVYGEPVLTTGLDALELSAANFYTRKILEDIQGVVTLDVINEENISTIVVLKVKECDKSQWNSEGIPCRHIFCAMKRVGLQKFSDSLLLKRWSNDAKKYLDKSYARGAAQDREREFLMRYGALLVAATWMVFLGAQDGPSFHDTMNKVCHWTQTLEQKFGLKRQTRDSPMPNFVGDPSVAKTKGAPKGKKERGKRRCTKCNSASHVKKKCPVRNDGDDLGDKTGSGTQASFSTEEASKIQYCISGASQGPYGFSRDISSAKYINKCICVARVWAR